jgi:transposase
MLNDLEGGRVWDLVEGRKEEQARELLQELDATQRAGVKAVAMDIWSAYRSAVEKLLPQADIVHDKFHLCAYLNKAVDTVRKVEHRQLAREGRQTLKGSKYLWLRNFPDLRLQPSFRQLYRLNLRTSRAWRLKETFGGFWQYCYEGSARKFFDDWLAQVTRSGLTPMKKVAAMFVRHLPGLLNYLKHRITNAASEGINSQTARIIANARGISCFENLRTRVLFFLGKLDLSPA